MDRSKLIIFLSVVLLSFAVWYFSQSQEYAPIDPSHFQKYIAIHVPSGHHHIIEVSLDSNAYLDLNDEVISQAHFAVFYDGQFVEVPSVLMPSSDGSYDFYFYTPVDGEHTVYLLLYPDQNMPREDQWDSVFIPSYRVVTLSVCDPDRPSLGYPSVAARYDPETGKLLIALGENENYVSGLPFNARIAFYALDPNDLNVLDSFCIKPSASVMFYGFGRYGVDADPDGSYYVAFWYDYDSGGYARDDDWEVYKIKDGSVVYSIPQPSGRRYPRAIELTPSGSLYIGSRGSNGYGSIALCNGTSCSYATFDLTYGSPYPCNSDTREHDFSSIWCTESGCVGVVYHSYCISEYVYGDEYDLVRISGTSVSSVYHNLGYNPTPGQQLGDKVYFYKYLYDSAGWHTYTLYPYWTYSTLWTNGKIYDGVSEHRVPGVPGTVFGSDGTHVFTFQSSPTEVNVYAMWYDVTTLSSDDLSSVQDIVQVPVFLRDVSQHYRLAHYVIDVDVSEPGTYDVYLLLDGDVVASYSVDLSGSQTLDYYVPVSVLPDSNHVLSVVLERQGFQLGRSEINAVFRPALIESYSQPDTLVQNEQSVFSVRYLVYNGDSSAVDFNVQGVIYNVIPTCAPSEYNMLSCVADYTYVPGSTGDLNYQYIIHVTIDGNTYTVSTPILSAFVQQQVVSPPTTTVVGPAPTEGSSSEEQGVSSVQSASPVGEYYSSLFPVFVVLAVVSLLFLLSRRR